MLKCNGKVVEEKPGQRYILSMMNVDINIFGNIVNINIPAQISGLIGMTIILIAYQQKKTRFVLLQAIGCMFCLLEALLCGGWVGATITSMCIARNIMMLYFLKKHDGAPLPVKYTLIHLAVCWALVIPQILANFSIFNLIPPIMLTISTSAAMFANYYIMKSGALIHEAGYLFYHMSIGAYAGVLRQIVLSSAVIISIIAMAIKDHSPKKPKGRKMHSNINFAKNAGADVRKAA
ncbi:MAG: YgjV family protein [Clostridia bacterium]|nr:YgjV family protein [Clostridia bacterium]MBP5649168.1 YgjV family protein [Clostridia bacterium]